jgi:uncharacterized protein (DUF433 family)
MTTSTGHRYVIRDPAIVGGEPIIIGTRTPVRAIVEIWRMGTPPEQIPEHLPHLSVAQVFDALSYFSDHVEEMKAAFDRNRISESLIDPSAGDL